MRTTRGRGGVGLGGEDEVGSFGGARSPRSSKPTAAAGFDVDYADGTRAGARGPTERPAVPGDRRISSNVDQTTACL